MQCVGRQGGVVVTTGTQGLVDGQGLGLAEPRLPARTQQNPPTRNSREASMDIRQLK